MTAHRNPRWRRAEIALLHESYPIGGVGAAHVALPDRSIHSIHVKAHRLGLKSAHVTHAPKPALSGDDLEQAIILREQQNWSFARIGAKFGVGEMAASNAILIALCPRKGYRPAERDCTGRLTEHGVERIRFALRKGLKACDIQFRLGVSASCVADQRRKYNADLKARGKAALPPPGGGEKYSGVKVPREARQQVEAMFLEGLGAAKISARTGVSKTTCTRIRGRLVRRLRRNGEALPGCDQRGVRHVQKESSRFIPPELGSALRQLIMEGVPVARAARMLAIGTCSAYRIRDELKAELAAKALQIPSPVRPGRVRAGAFAQQHWPPVGARQIYAFRELLRDMSFDQAKAEWRRRQREIQLERAKLPASFEERLLLVRQGKMGIVRAIERRHLEPAFTPEVAA